MSFNINETRTFTISVTGEKSGVLWHGEFKALRRLTHRQELNRDRITRELLGEHPESASQRAKDQAELLAEIKVSLTECPDWFKNMGWGEGSVDDTLIAEIWSNIIKIKMEAMQEVQKKADEASQKLESAIAQAK